MRPIQVFLLPLSVVLLALLIEPAASAPASQAQALHVLNRLGYGPVPGEVERVAQQGVEAYIEQQLDPARLNEPAELTERLARLESLKATPGQLYVDIGPPARKAAGDEAARKAVSQRQKQTLAQAREARLLRALYSPAQLREVMVDFWFNHFNVFAGKGQEGAIWTGLYERDAIRPHVMGRFRDLLGATARHPAMLYYLDNWRSRAPAANKQGKKERGGINENYARELMELHTLGVDGGYTQKDVTELARILTGWTFRPKDGAQLGFRFEPDWHDRGEKRFLGQTFPAGGAVEEGERALDLLARSPATARHIAYKLVQYFVADEPPPALVQRLAERFTDSGGDISAVLRTLFHSPEFLGEAYAGKKFKTPYAYVLSAVRASGRPMVTDVGPLLGAMAQAGQTLYGCPTPDGYKNTQSAWLNPDSLLRRLNFASALGGGYPRLWRSPDPAAVKRQKPPKGIALDVEQLRSVLGAKLSPSTIEALAAVDPRLRAGLLLGSPEFMYR